jgi:hypothetical protein
MFFLFKIKTLLQLHRGNDRDECRNIMRITFCSLLLLEVVECLPLYPTFNPKTHTFGQIVVEFIPGVSAFPLLLTSGLKERFLVNTKALLAVA